MLAVLARSQIVPVLTIEDAAHAVPLAEALLEGGIRVLEVTLRTGAALAAVEAIARHVPGRSSASARSPDPRSSPGPRKWARRSR